jgi:hypothetical protein
MKYIMGGPTLLLLVIKIYASRTFTRIRINLSVNISIFGIVSSSHEFVGVRTGDNILSRFSPDIEVSFSR